MVEALELRTVLGERRTAFDAGGAAGEHRRTSGLRTRP